MSRREEVEAERRQNILDLLTERDRLKAENEKLREEARAAQELVNGELRDLFKPLIDAWMPK